MAEVVERNIEDSLSEFLHIRKARLFSENEIRDIIRRRRQHEYSLQKRNKRITDFDSYIATELGIMKLISLRRNKTSDFRFADKIEKSIISRIVRLHRQACYRFQSRVDVWIRFIWFNRQLGRHMSVVRLWDRLLQVHGRTDPRLWSSAASFHLNEGAAAQARGALSKLKTELRALGKTKKRVADLEKTPSCTTEGLEKLQLSRLQASLGRSLRLSWDRAFLHGLREARRLLAQGLAFNENSTFLLLELLKLEGAAADFFKKRVALRKQQAAYVKSEAMMSLDGKTSEIEEDEAETRKIKGGLKKRRKLDPAESDKKDALAFLLEVTEDVDFVISGGTFNLVLTRLLAVPCTTSIELQTALEIAGTFFSFAEAPLIQEITQKLKSNSDAERTMHENIDSKAVEKANTRASELESLSSRVFQLRRLLDTVSVDDVHSGVEAALAAWNTWYHPPSRLLQVQDPSSTPQWVDLLATRLLIVAISKMRGQSLLNRGGGEDSVEILRRYNEYRVVHGTRVADARGLLDALATSSWGSKSSAFWRLYMEFERKFGECSRLPSLQWRGEKSLEEAALVQFHRTPAQEFF